MNDILATAIEIEGLVRVIKDGNPLPETFSLLQEKVNLLQQLSLQLTPVPTSAIENELSDESLQVYAENVVAEAEVQAETNSEPEPKPEPESESIPETEPEPKSESIPETAPGIEEDVDVDFVVDDDDILLSTDVADDADPVEVANPDFDHPSRINSKDARNLRSCFSLNDRFLYSRELFNGDMKMFDSSVKAVEGVSDFSVVEDYFYNELDLDPDNEFVKSFMMQLQRKF